MKRLWYVLGFGVLIGVFDYYGVGSSARPLAVPSTAGDWKLAEPASCFLPSPAERATWPGTSGARQMCRATFAGTPAMNVTLYEMPNRVGTSAFDAAQKFPAQPGKMGFFQGSYFGVVESG